MRTIIKIDGVELFEFKNGKTFILGEEVKCYGKPHIVTSIERKRTNVRDEEEVIVTIIAKEIYNGIKVSEKDLHNYGITVPRNKIDSLTIKVNNAPSRPFTNRNPFDSMREF